MGGELDPHDHPRDLIQHVGNYHDHVGCYFKKVRTIHQLWTKTCRNYRFGVYFFFFVMITTREVYNWRFWSLFHHWTWSRLLPRKRRVATDVFPYFSLKKNTRHGSTFPFLFLLFPVFPCFSIIFPLFHTPYLFQFIRLPPPRIRTPLYLNVYVFVTFWGVRWPDGV